MSIKLGPKVVEALLIVVSILFAFANDAWGDERKDRTQELCEIQTIWSSLEENS